MTKQSQKEALRELMTKWVENRARWIAERGNDVGFAEWFTCQVTGK